MHVGGVFANSKLYLGLFLVKELDLKILNLALIALSFPFLAQGERLIYPATTKMAKTILKTAKAFYLSKDYDQVFQQHFQKQKMLLSRGPFFYSVSSGSLNL